MRRLEIVDSGRSPGPRYIRFPAHIRNARMPRPVFLSLGSPSPAVSRHARRRPSTSALAHSPPIRYDVCGIPVGAVKVISGEWTAQYGPCVLSFDLDMRRSPLVVALGVLSYGGGSRAAGCLGELLWGASPRPPLLAWRRRTFGLGGSRTLRCGLSA